MRPWISLAPVWLAGLLLIYWQWVDLAAWNPLGGPPIQMIAAKPLHPEARAGGTITVDWRYTVDRQCPRTVELFLRNHVTVLISSHSGSTRDKPPGLRQVRSVTRLPSSLEPGPAELVSVSHWQCNPLRTYTSTTAVPFRVVP